jgi:hypothetical protein
MQDIIKRFTSRKFLITLATLVGAYAALVACTPKDWRNVLDARDELCDAYLDLVDAEGLTKTEEERLAYRTACRTNPQLALEAAEAASHGDPVSTLPVPTTH